MTPVFADLRLLRIRDKVERGERLNSEDGLALYRTPDLLGVGWMANQVRERLHGNQTFFNVNRHINPTDVCVASCKLCAFGKNEAKGCRLACGRNSRSRCREFNGSSAWNSDSRYDTGLSVIQNFSGKRGRFSLTNGVPSCE
jgi:hypothetical protein